MIDKYKNLKRIALKDGKYYLSPNIKELKEFDDFIELVTNEELINIPKTAISRIEYYKGAVAHGSHKR